jgi:glucose-1-phosphate thymidylyltransferase
VDRFKAVVLANACPDVEQPFFSRKQARELVCVANRPVLVHVLEALRDASADEVVLIVDPRNAEEIRETVGDGSGWQLTASYVPGPGLGLVDGIRAAAPVIGEGPAVACPGNGIVLGGLESLLHRFERRRLSAMVWVPGADGVGAGGAQPSAPALLDFHGEPTAICILGPEACAAALVAEPSWRGEREVTDLIRILTRAGRSVETMSGGTWWSYNGTADDLLAGNRLLLDELVADTDEANTRDSVIEGRVAISPAASVMSTMIRGPAIIGAGAVLVDAHIGPYTAIGHRALVSGVEIDDSIVMPGALVSEVGSRITGSVIGESAIVNRGNGLRGVLELAVAHGSTATVG